MNINRKLGDDSLLNTHRSCFSDTVIAKKSVTCIVYSGIIQADVLACLLGELAVQRRLRARVCSDTIEDLSSLIS